MKPVEWEQRIVLFTGFWVENRLKSTIIKSYLSAIRALLWECNVRLNEDFCLLNSLMRACKIKYDKLTHHLPIHTYLLKMIVLELRKYFRHDEYLVKLFSATYMLAYYGLLRIGEIGYSPHAVKSKNVHIGANKRKFLFIFTTSKTHGEGNKPQQVKFTSTPIASNSTAASRSELCPYETLKSYIAVRSPSMSETEQFFVYADGTPVKMDCLRKYLKKMIKLLNLNPASYCFHGFRSGRSGDLLKCGVSIEMIKKLGRWKSNAVFTYLKD